MRSTPNPRDNRSVRTRGTVLVVEDDSDTRAFLVRAIRDQGHFCLARAEPEAAMRLLDAVRVDLALVDADLPARGVRPDLSAGVHCA